MNLVGYGHLDRQPLITQVMTDKRLVTFNRVFQIQPSAGWHAEILPARNSIFLSILATIFLAFFSAPNAVFGQKGEENWNRSELVFGSQVPQNRERERQIEAAEKLIEARRYSDAVKILQSLLQVSDDSVFVDQTSLKARATKMIADLPQSGRRTLQTMIEVPLKKEVQRAVGKHDQQRLAEMAAQNPPEAMGQDAWIAWAWVERELGNQLFASAISRELESSDQTVSGSISLVEELDQIHDQFAGRHQRSEIASEPLPKWLRRHSPQNWIAPQAESDRSFQISGPLPTPWRAWTAVTCPDVNKEREIDATRSRLTEGASQLTSLNAIAVDGKILFRQSNQLVAVEAATGRRLWATSLAIEQGARESFDHLRYYLGSYFSGEVSQQGWLDRSRGVITSDSEQVFAVIDVPQPMDQASEDRRFFWGRSNLASIVNAVVAFSIPEQGKRKWILDGSASEGEYSGFRFLGAPVAVEDYLAVLAEREKMVYFLLVNGRDGKLLWKQPISNRESNDFSPHLALTGYSPIWKDGKFYCSGGDGIVAAINPLRRSIEWISYVPVDQTLKVMQMRRNQQIGLRQAERRIRTGDGWRSTSLFTFEDALIVAPVESDRVACYERHTGELLWSMVIRNGNLVAGVSNHVPGGQILVLKPNSISAYSIKDGKSLWEMSMPGNSKPVGEGIQLNDQYLLPLSSGRIASVSLAKNEKQRVTYERLLPGPLRSPIALGNLIWHQGAVYSRSPTSIEKFIQPNKEQSLLDQADRMLAEGEYQKAEKLLAQASQSELLSEEELQSRKDMAVGLASLAGEREKLSERQSKGEFSDDLQKLHPFEAKLFDFHAAIGGPQEELKAMGHELLVMPEAKRTLLMMSPKHQVRADRWIEEKIAEESSLKPTTSGEQSQASAVAHRFNSNWRSNQVRVQHWVTEKQETEYRQNSSYYYSRQRNTISRRLPVRSKEADSLSWRYISDGNDEPRIVCRDRLGEVCFSEIMEDSLRTNFQAVNLGQPSPCYWDGMFYVQLDNALHAYNMETKRGNESVAWSYDPALFTDYQAIRFYDPSKVKKTREIKRRSTNSNQLPSLFWVDSAGAIVLVGGKIMSLDPKSGKLLWSRNDLNSFDRVFVHEDRVYLGRTSSRTGNVFSKYDGRLLGEWYVPGNSWRMYHSGKILTSTRSELKLYDFTSDEKKPVWTAPLSGSQYTLLNNQLYLLDASRKLTCLDIAKAEVQFQTNLDPEYPISKVKLISCFKRDGALFVALSSKNNTDLRQKGLTPIDSSPLVEGNVYCLDPVAGQSHWPRPIELNGMAAMKDLLPNSPFLIFLSKKQRNEIDTNQGDYRILVTNRWTGATLYRNGHLPGERKNFITICELVEQHPMESITLQVGRSQMRFELSEAVSPPSPPAISSVEREKKGGIALNEFEEGFKKLWGSITEPDKK